MQSSNFQFYNKGSETPGNDYWKFLDASKDDLKNDNINLYSINEIIEKITNNELKNKMIKKVYDLAIENGVSYKDIYASLDIFTSNEIKQLLEHEFKTRIIEYTTSEDVLKQHSSELISIVKLFKIPNDITWEYQMNSNVLDRIKDFTNKEVLVNIFELNMNRDIYTKLLEKYKYYLPTEYNNYLKIIKDPYYIMNKMPQFKNIDIGIDPKISIGPEIEANNDYALILDIKGQRGFDEYTISTDATVPNGSEVSPSRPFHNTPNDVAKFCALCEAMKEMGYYYSEYWQNASGQINLGLDYLDTKEAILNFYEIYCNCEELLYYISSEEGQLFRQSVYTNSRIKAISEIIGRRILDENLTRSEVIELFNTRPEDNKAINKLQYKKNSVCLRGTNERDYRLEFRIPNGGCNYKTWIDNIRLYGEMLEVAKKLADMMKKDYLTDEENAMLKLKIELQNNDLSFEEKLKILMDLLFKDDNIKQIYYNRYSATIKKINETHTLKYKNNNIYEPNFDTVLFEEQYESRLNLDNTSGYSIEYDPKTDVIKKH